MGRKVEPANVVRIILGSVPPELASARAAVERTLERLGKSSSVRPEWIPYIDEDGTPPRRRDLARRQIYIGLLAGQGDSIEFEPEYRRALEAGLHCLVFVKLRRAPTRRTPRTKPPTGASSFAAELMRSGAAISFSSPRDLEAKVTAEMILWPRKQRPAPRSEQRVRSRATKQSRTARLIRAIGHRSVAVGGSIEHSIVITGDHNFVYQAIVTQYPSLKEYAIDFGDLIKRTTEGFVGRDKIFEQMGQFAKHHQCGYFRVVADAGLGKTALAAEAAKRLNAPAFFADARGGLTQPHQCLNHFAAELTARFRLSHDHLPLHAGESSKFLFKLLGEAAAKTKGPLWIVVDALDEARAPDPGSNPLLLPPQLPRRVFAFLTHRAKVGLAVDPPTADEEVTMAGNDRVQQADIAMYLRRQAKRPEIRRAREAARPRRPAEEFVTILQEKSEGNFKYLDHVLSDIAEWKPDPKEPARNPLDLDALPRGLRGYYTTFWEQIAAVRGREGWAEWNSLYQPVIAFLAAAREPVPADWLGGLLGRSAEEVEERALEPWRRFLGQDNRGSEPRWQVVHQSFTDFLVEEKKVDLRAAHDRVASHYLTAWGGLEAGLPALFDSPRLEESDGYGLRHLAEHLDGAGRAADLHSLLRLEHHPRKEKAEPPRALNLWFTIRERAGDTEGFLNDLARAARLVQVVDPAGEDPSRLRTNIGLGIRYALLSASLNSLALTFPPPLITALVEKGVWLPRQGLAYARRIPDPEQRVQALTGIGACSTLNGTERGNVLREALEVTRTMPNEWLRAEALAALLPHLGEDQLRIALDVAGALTATGAQAKALVGLLPRLEALGHAAEAPETARAIADHGARARVMAVQDRAREAFESARSVEDPSQKARVLATIAPLLNESLLRRALKVARRIADERSQAEALAALVPQLATLGHLDEAMDAANAMDDREYGTALYKALTLARLGHAEESLDWAKGMEEEEVRSDALRQLAPHLGYHLIYAAVEAAKAIGDDYARETALATLVARLATLGRPREALEAMEAINDHGFRAEALAGIILHLDSVPGALDEVLTDIATHPPLPRARRLLEGERPFDQTDRLKVLAALAPHLSQSQLRMALDAALLIGDVWSRDQAVYEMVARLAALGRPEAAMEIALTIADEGPRGWALADVVAHLGKALVSKVVEIAQSLSHELSRTKLLAALVTRLAALGQDGEAAKLVPTIENPTFRAEALAASGHTKEALETARAIADEWPRSNALAAVAPYLGEAQIREAIDTAQAITDENGQPEAMAALLPRLGTFGRGEEALDLAPTIEDESARAHALAALYPSLSDAQLRKAFETASAIERGDSKVEAMAALVPRLVAFGLADDVLKLGRRIEDKLILVEALAASGKADEALEPARTIEDEDHRVKALTTLAPRLSEALLPSALQAARAIASDRHRVVALAALAARLAALPPATLLPLWWETLRLAGMQSRRGLMSDLFSLTPVIVALGGPEAIQESHRAIQDVGRWWP
jgi:hypothetical protein